MREKYESLSLSVLKELAKARGLKGVSALKKEELVERMLQADEMDKNRNENTKTEKAQKQEGADTASRQTAGPRDGNAIKEEIAGLDSGITVSGILEVMQEGFGFIRSDNYLPGENDVYVSPSQIRRFNLKTGDIVCGNTRVKTEKEKFSALLFVSTVNGMHPAEAQRRPSFENLTPIFPNQRLRLERPGASVAMRVVDLISPIGKGQRGMIVSQPKAGKTTL